LINDSNEIKKQFKQDITNKNEEFNKKMNNLSDEYSSKLESKNQSMLKITKDFEKK